MDESVKKIPVKPGIPPDVQERWQRLLDALAGVTGLNAALITRAESGSIEFFLSSRASSDSRQTDKTCDLNLSGYCEQVMRQRTRLLVSEASKEAARDESSVAAPDTAYYLGYPLLWPDGELFGTICVHDRQDPARAEQIDKAVAALRGILERELLMVTEAEDRAHRLEEIARQQSLLQQLIATQTDEITHDRETIKGLLLFEDLVSECSAQFLSVHVADSQRVVTSALERLKAFFQAEGCGIFEVWEERNRVESLASLDDSKSPPIIGYMISPGHPWVYQRLVGEGEPLILSTLETIPAEAAALSDRENWGVRSLFLVPIGEKKRPSHLIGLWTKESERKWSVLFYRRLVLLGEIITKALVHQRDYEDLLKEKKRLGDAERLAHVGSWEWDLSSGEIVCSDEVFRIFGFSPQEFRPTFEKYLELVQPEDRPIVMQVVKDVLADPQKEHTVEHRVLRPDASQRHVVEVGKVIIDAEGKPAKMIGAVMDITEQRLGEQALKKALGEIGKYKEQLEAENIYLRQEAGLEEGFTDVVGQSDAIRYVQFRVRKVARSKTTVLLTGETGTGKGVFARVLHEESDRRGKPFVHVNCAGLPSNLIESELFGREKGAFTGSSQRQIGRFELANGGTIFLDEIGELPLELQPKLLRVIESGEFERLGSPHTIKVDVRLVASTNKNLEEETQKGLFRRDLYYRLNVFPITIPPLSQRQDDIPLLVKFYTEKFNRTFNKQITKVPAETMRTFENYDWPGNVRELINLVERAVILSDGPALELPERIGFFAASEGRKDTGLGSKQKGLADVEREHVLGTLREADWRIEGSAGAATLLGMKPSTLRARMKKLGIKRPKVQSDETSALPGKPPNPTARHPHA